MARGFARRMVWKWLIAVAGAALIGWFSWFQLNSTKISYVNGLAPYDVMPGREYLLQMDCLVFAWRNDGSTRYPLLGVNHPSAFARTEALPSRPSPADIGKTTDEIRIIDFIPKGTPMLILSVRREQTRKNTTITYEVKFLDEKERPYLRTDIRPVLLSVAHGSDVPRIDPTIAVPWVKR